MSVSLLNDHVLVAHPPDWQSAIRIRRQWRTLSSQAVTGREDRAAAVPKPRHRLTFQVLAGEHGTRADLVDAIMAASKSGLAVVPFWGRATRLDGPASGDTVAIAQSPWTWRKDDLAFFSTPEPEWEIRTVTNVGEGSLTLDASLSRTFYHFVWPLLFGRFRSGGLRWLNLTAGTVPIDIEQLEIVPDPPLPSNPYDDFEGYAEGFCDDQTLNGGQGWNGAWLVLTRSLGVIAVDSFQFAAEGPADGITGGAGWATAWTAVTRSFGVVGGDDFQGYPENADLNDQAGGDGFATPWLAVNRP